MNRLPHLSSSGCILGQTRRGRNMHVKMRPEGLIPLLGLGLTLALPHQGHAATRAIRGRRRFARRRRPRPSRPIHFLSCVRPCAPMKVARHVPERIPRWVVISTGFSDSILRGPHHGYGALVLNLGRNNRLWRLGCRRDDRCRLAFGLDAHGIASGHSRIDKPLWVGSGGQKDRLAISPSPSRLPISSGHR
jgi:hypothetical protein